MRFESIPFALKQKPSLGRVIKHHASGLCLTINRKFLLEHNFLGRGELGREICRSGDWWLASISRTFELLPPASRVHKCPVTCGSKLNPVCGSDGYTYQNRCLLAAGNCQRSPTEEEVTEVHAGRCDDEEFVLEDEVDDGYSTGMRFVLLLQHPTVYMYHGKD